MTHRLNRELALAREFVEFTQKNVFLTGKAGTGKTTFLHRLKADLPKRMVVVAPTGVAAINAGGVTIHSFFQLPFGPILPGTSRSTSNESRMAYRFSRQKVDIIRTLDLLVIDEISMVRADLLDGIDEVLRRYRRDERPFGGVQLLMIGDLQQLAPVVKTDEWELLKNYYDSSFFFGSRALQKTGYVTVELKHVYRQEDEKFIEILNMIRDNNLNRSGLEMLNRCYRPEVLKNPDPGFITLTTHNYQAQKINDSRLESLVGEAKKFVAQVDGHFPESNYPTEAELLLKVGAQVMFVKNDLSPQKLYFNGKIGVVVGFKEDVILVKCPDNEEPIEVKPDKWENVKYVIDEQTKEIREEVEGSFTQYPLKTAWAITIHKSQGLTFEKAIIDANAAFAHGQVYVALSRCKSLEGLVLTNPLDVGALKTDREVKNFVRQVEENPVDEATLKRSKQAYGLTLLNEMFDFSRLGQQLGYLRKLTNEHEGSIGTEMNMAVSKMKEMTDKELTPVAERFKIQLKKLMGENADIATNVLLQERIKKACIWFYDQITTGLVKSYENLSVETDNKELRKMLKRALDQLESELRVKAYVFQSCRAAFTVKNYLEARAKALLEEYSVPKNAVNSEKSVDVSVRHPELYARLKNWRNSVAAEAGLPVYMVLQVKSMKHLANRLPASINELKTISGLGKVKLEKYGAQIIQIVQDYCKEKNITPDENSGEETNPPKKPKTSTKEVTLNLFREGKSIKEIAAERHLTQNTIYNHLGYYVRKGEVAVFQLVSAEKVNAVVDWLRNNNAKSLTEIKQHFGEEISWEELRLIVNHCEYLKGKRNAEQKTS